MIHRTRRGVALLVVLMLVVMGVLAASTVLMMSRASAMTVAASVRATQSRAMAWAGVQAIMAELGGQRSALLRGETPVLTASWTLFDEGGRRGVVRLIPRAGTAAQPEGAKLDINHATREMLAALPDVGDELAASIVMERGRGRFQSVEDLLRVRGITAAALYGETIDDSTTDDMPDEGLSRPRLALVDVLTAFSFDPQLQAGVRAADDAGLPRLNAAKPWTTELQDTLSERCGENSASSMTASLQGRVPPRTTAELWAAVERAGLDQSSQAEVLDAMSAGGDPFISGLIDLSSASATVLAAVPGFDAQVAAQIISARKGLSSERRGSPLWPLHEGLVSPEQMSQAINHLTVRSMQWRVRVEAGIESGTPSDDRSRSGDLGELELRDRMVIDAVIDLTDARPRLAYLRDSTLLETAAAILYAEEGAEPPAEDEPVSVGAESSGGALAGIRQTDPLPDLAPEGESNPEAATSEVVRGYRLGRWMVSKEDQATGERSRSTSGD